MWKAGKMHGKGKTIAADGAVTHGTWDNGSRVELLPNKKNEK